jgi:hypothetical protein
MSVRLAMVCVLAVGLFVATGCQRTPARLYPPDINASAAGTQAMETYDADKNGTLSGAELDKCPALKSAMARIDTTGEGSITAAKITARIQAWQKSKLARIPVTCSVLHNGKPLADADVKLVPEKFLGPNMQTASGHTDKNGVVMPSVPTTGREDPPGAAPGFYRVEITKAGESIPAKYNTETTLGVEVASGVAELREGLRCDLKY